MRIIDNKNSLHEIKNMIISKARYQKVVICLDDGSDVQFVEELVDAINKDVIVLKYYYNKHNISALHDMINNGVRVVVYNVSLEHFYKLQIANNFVLNIFLLQSTFVLPYLVNTESVYGDNLLVCDTSIKDYMSVLFLYELALNKVWNLLVQEVDADTTIFKNIDALVNGKVDFYQSLATQVAYLKPCLDNNYKDVAEEQLPYYVYLRLCATLKMLENLNQNKEQYIDFYKTEISPKAIEKAYSLLIKYKLTELLKFNSGNLIKINCAILNRVKIIIKKYFNFKNIKLNKLNKLIKHQAKALNIDNLLYISYILNTI